MRVRLPQKELQQATQVVSALVGRASSPMPVLSTILIIAEKGVIRLEGTDIESQVIVTASGNIEREGRTTVEASRLASLVKLFPAGSDVVIDASDGKALISCESNEYKLLTMPTEDFPEWTRETGTTRIRLEAKALKYMLGAAQYAVASGKDGRRVLYGVFVEIKDNTLRFTATDGKKLSRVTKSISEVEGKGETSLILPAKPAAEIQKSLPDEGPVDIEFAPRQIFVTAGNVTFRTQSIDGKYPDCDAVIPKEFPFEVRFDRDRFLNSVRRAGIVANDQNRSILMKLAENSCDFQSVSHDIGSFNGKMPVQYSGETIRIAFNWEYLIETVSGFSDPEIRMFLKSSNSPIIFRSEKEPDRLALLMPIKLTSVPTMDGNGDDAENAGE